MESINTKKFNFRGKTLEELQAMSLAEFGKLCKSRPRRALVNGIDKKFLKKIEANIKNAKAKPVRTQRRDIVIIPAMVGAKVAVHRGNSYESIDITEKMLGHYLGEFALTRKRLQHGKAGIGATKSSSAVTAR